MSTEERETTPAAAEIEAWLVRYVADLVSAPVDSIDPTIPIARYGVDSAAAIALTGDVGEWLGFPVDPTIPYDHPTLRAVARQLAQDAAAAKRGRAA